jgi:two-component system, chemotaxis family, chemotaxis protein CheY
MQQAIPTARLEAGNGRTSTAVACGLFLSNRRSPCKEVMKKILVVEDSTTMRNLIVMSVSGLKGVEVTPSIHGLDALKKIQDQVFDLVITDINMPFMDGLKLVQFIRGKQEYSAVPIIIVTTRGQDEDRQRGMKLGANAYLPKPIKTFELQRTVKEFLHLS